MARVVLATSLVLLLSADAHAAAWLKPSTCEEYTSNMGGAQAGRGLCGTRDTIGRWSGVGRLCQYEAGQDPTTTLCSNGCTTTFIEDDVIASEAHCLGYDPTSANCCDSPGSTGATVCGPTGDMANQVYVAAGDDQTSVSATVIVGKVMAYGVRSTGMPPGYDIYVAHVNRSCDICNTTHTVTPIPMASAYPSLGASSTWVFTAGTGGQPSGSYAGGQAYAFRQYVSSPLDKPVGSSESSQPCRRQGVLMRPSAGNPLAISDTSGSPVFVSECGHDALHGFHGNGEAVPWCSTAEMSDGGTYQCEILQLVQSQKQWIQAKVTEWTGRGSLRDACTGSRSSTDPYNETQYSCRTDSGRITGGSSGGVLYTCAGGSVTVEDDFVMARVIMAVLAVVGAILFCGGIYLVYHFLLKTDPAKAMVEADSVGAQGV